MHVVFQDVFANLVGQDFQQHGLARDEADVRAEFAHLVLPVPELFGDVVHRGNGREILELRATVELHEFVAPLVLHKEGTPKLKAIPIDPISQLDPLLINVLANPLGNEVPQVESQVPSIMPPIAHPLKLIIVDRSCGFLSVFE